MKPAPFEYHLPGSAQEAASLLAEYGDGAKLLAGGRRFSGSLTGQRRPAVRLPGASLLDHREDGGGRQR